MKKLLKAVLIGVGVTISTILILWGFTIVNGIINENYGYFAGFIFAALPLFAGMIILIYQAIE